MRRRHATALMLGAPLARPAWAEGTPKFPVPTGRWVHAIAAFGEPRYGPDFKAFDYVNPAAPKGGTLRLCNPDRRASFDKFNPFTLKGVAPAAMVIFVFETLCVRSMDEPAAMYGQLVESMYVAPDLLSMTLRVRANVRFSDGSPLTAADIVHSFTQLTGKGAAPSMRTPLLGVAGAQALDERTVRFDFKEAKVDNLFTVGDLYVFSRKWGDGKPFDQIVTDWPIATGPYALGRAEMPRRLDLVLRKDYWGVDVPVRRGHFNFARVNYRMYKDDEVRREAFKAGEFDIMRELTARHFARTHRGPKWDDGRIVKQVFPVQFGNMFQSFNFNLRREKFQDIRVREAIDLAWDFETINKYKTFRAANSMFANTEFAAQGLPSAEELKLLEPFRAELPARVFGPAYVKPPTDAHPNALRDNLKRAAALLADAGWKIGGDGWLRNARGQTLDIEYADPVRIGRFAEFERNLRMLGVRYSERLIDFALFRQRNEKFDFDVVIIVEGKFNLPDVGDLASLYGSRSGKEPGGANYRGVDSRAVDALIERIAAASTMDELRAAARALDRVVTWNFWQIPMLYASTEPTSYWNKFGIPATLPKYYNIDTLIEPRNLPWPLWTWWDKTATAAR